MVNVRSTRNLLANSYYQGLGGDESPHVWVSVFKAVTPRRKWWQGWQLKLPLRKPLRVQRIEGQARASSKITFDNQAAHIYFQSVEIAASAGTYVAMGIRASRHDEQPFDVTDIVPVTLAYPGVIMLIPEFQMS